MLTNIFKLQKCIVLFLLFRGGSGTWVLYEAEVGPGYCTRGHVPYARELRDGAREISDPVRHPLEPPRGRLKGPWKTYAFLGCLTRAPGAPGAPGRPPKAIRRSFGDFRGAPGSPRDLPRTKPKNLQRRSQPQDRHLRSKTLPGAPGGWILGTRTQDLASRGPRNLRSRETLPPKKETLYVGRRSMSQKESIEQSTPVSVHTGVPCPRRPKGT
jgi:hypothetical protein